jgi:hypothetical protein
MGSAAQVILHFVGLILFTVQTPDIYNNTQLAKALRMGGTTLNTSTPARLPSTVVAILPRVIQPVEAHSAFLAFRACDYDGSSGWDVIDLGRDGLLYVLLKGEHLSFTTSAVNPPINLPAKLNDLPHLKDIWGGDHPLQSGYEPPAYSAAAAVVDLPAGFRRACTAITKPTVNRTDTEVTLNTNGFLIVHAGTKTLTLRITNGSVVTIGNVPPLWRDHLQDSAATAPHYQVYCDMTADPNHACNQPTEPLLQPCSSGTGSFITVSSGGSGTTTSGSSAAARTSQASLPMAPHQERAQQRGGSETPQTVSFECSNTQWP